MVENIVIDLEQGLKTYLTEVGKVVGTPQAGSVLDWAFRRAQLEKIAKALSPPHPTGVVIEDQCIVCPDREIPIRIYRPASAGDTPLLLFFHGGGWVFGSVATHDYLAAILAKSIDCTVISVDYRLAPEHPFSAILDDCYDALEWAHRNHASLRIDPSRIGISGDSAGAHLAACCAMRSHREGHIAMALQLLFYPMIEPAFELSSYTTFAQAPGLTKVEAIAFWKAAFGDPLPEIPDFAAPAKADAHLFPPSYVLTAEFDPLRDEGERFARRLSDAARPVVLWRAAGMMHGFLRAIPYSPPARHELDLACAWARNLFAV